MMNKILIFTIVGIFFVLHAYSSSRDVQVDLSHNGLGYCYKPHDNSGTYAHNSWVDDSVFENICTQTRYANLNSGEWIAQFTDIYINGTSFCTDITPSESLDDASSYYGSVAHAQDALNQAYDTWVAKGRNSVVTGNNCYCKSLLSENSKWVFNASMSDNTSCEHYCSFGCARDMINDVDFYWSVL